MTTILYIDADRACSLMLRSLLTSEGFAVEVASDGLEGVRKARELQPDLILVDLILPRLDGFEVIKQLQECSLTWDIPVIFMSVFPPDRSCLLAKQTGVQGFVRKPFQGRELIEVVIKNLSGCSGVFSASILN